MAPVTLLITGSGRLLTPDPYDGPLPWAIAVSDGRVTWVGARSDAPPADDVLDVGSALVTPGLVDAHTHPVFAGDRSDEAAARLAGEPYTGGGILRTVQATRAASDDDLEALVLSRLAQQLQAGTTTVEAKSGYGLSQAEELRHLRIIRRVAARVPIRVVPTFLGAHARPPDRPAFVDEIVDAMLPAVAAEGLADFCDVFCDAGFFTVEEAERILRAASAAGLGTRLHADQLERIGASGLAVRLGATSADHLEQLDAEGVRLLAASPTVATLLPGPALVMRDRLPPARALLDGGATVALASDANAGTFGAWGAMPLVIGLGSTLLGMSPLEAVRAATLGGAAALALGGERGQLAPGAVADLVAWDAEHEGAFALHLGSVRPRHVLVAGKDIAGND
ncbi:MAG TPA: imidazolonepropionase [Candidatus Limnocylindria bacterium]|nr:imidazolonepropionase [Candidatus Limnocylindria bacterium]